MRPTRGAILAMVLVFLAIIVLLSYLIVQNPKANSEVSEIPQKQATESPPRFSLEVFGNANGDELVDEKDLEFIRSIIEGRSNATAYSDANRDGKIDEEDLNQVKALIEGRASYIWMLDGNGEPVRVRLPVRRIGVEYLSNVELLLILGASDKIVAVDFAPYQLRKFYFPNRADEVVNMGNMHQPDYELLSKLDLDLLLTFSFDVKEKREKLPGVDVVFLGLYWPDVTDVSRSRFIQGIMKAGYILGKVDRAREYVNWLIGLMDSIRGRLSEIPEEKRPLVLMTAMTEYLRDPEKKALRTYSSADTLSQMCILAGGRPIGMYHEKWLEKSYYFTVDLEWVLEKNPEFIFVHMVRYTYGAQTLAPSYGYDEDSTESLESAWKEVTSRPLLSDVEAVKRGRVYLIAGDFRNNAMGGVLGAVYLANVLHPELFKDLNPREIHQEYVTKWMGIDYDLRKHGTFLYPPIFGDGEKIGVPSG